MTNDAKMATLIGFGVIAITFMVIGWMLGVQTISSRPIICESQPLIVSNEPYTLGTMTCNVGSVKGPQVTVIVVD